MAGIAELLSADAVGRTAHIRGWLYRTRSSGGIVFAVVRDGTGILQVTVKKGAVPDADYDAASRALIESAVEVEGIIAEDRRAPGGYELRASQFVVHHFAAPFPITADQSEEFLLDQRHLWVRSREQVAISRVKASALRGARGWFDAQGFIEVTPPILTGVAAEGTTTLFSLKYFDREGYLSQSAQFYLEALCFSLENVWALTPSFRAEKSRTTRHLTEFWHLEAEEAWVDWQGNMKIQEELLCAMVAQVLEERKAELELLKRDPAELERLALPFPRITYAEALDRLRPRGFELRWGDGFGAQEERALTEDSAEPLFVTNFPKETKAFYMKEDSVDPRTYRCNDLLAPEGFGEIIGASERETDYDALVARLQAQGSNLADYQWYLDLRRFGSVPHSGFGLGIERVVRWLCKLTHIRDALPFPRTPARLTP